MFLGRQEYVAAGQRTPAGEGAEEWTISDAGWSAAVNIFGVDLRFANNPRKILSGILQWHVRSCPLDDLEGDYSMYEKGAINRNYKMKSGNWPPGRVEELVQFLRGYRATHGPGNGQAAPLGAPMGLDARRVEPMANGSSGDNPPPVEMIRSSQPRGAVFKVERDASRRPIGGKRLVAEQPIADLEDSIRASQPRRAPFMVDQSATLRPMSGVRPDSDQRIADLEGTSNPAEEEFLALLDPEEAREFRAFLFAQRHCGLPFTEEAPLEQLPAEDRRKSGAVMSESMMRMDQSGR